MFFVLHDITLTEAVFFPVSEEKKSENAAHTKKDEKEQHNTTQNTSCKGQATSDIKKQIRRTYLPTDLRSKSNNTSIEVVRTAPSPKEATIIIASINPPRFVSYYSNDDG